METLLKIENGNTLAAIQALLKKLLQAGIVDALLVPMRTPSGTVSPALVSQAELLHQADPLAPVMPVNSATLAGKVSIRQPRPRIGVVGRACELRALVELAKMQQASLDDLILISIDCSGTYSVPAFLKKEQGSKQPLWQELFSSLRESRSTSPDLRTACRICEKPVFEKAQIRLRLLGHDQDSAIPLEVDESIASMLELTPQDTNLDDSLLPIILEKRVGQRDLVFEDLRTRMNGDEDISTIFAACIRCHNCMTVCPICYCKTCVFKSAVFDHEPMQFIEWTRQKGAFRMPADTTLFHLTRLNHMVLSCVGCGMCTEACPSELPVGLVFRTVGARVQKTFDYAPGNDAAEMLPLVTFKADEWTEVGE
jgi:formate dehydrogenase subunit beta